MPWSTYLEEAVLGHVLRVAAYPLPGQTAVGLFTVAPTQAGGGTEVGARQVAFFNTPDDGETDTSNMISYTGLTPADEIVAVGIFDATADGNLLMFKVLDDPYVVPGSGGLAIPANALVAGFA